MQIHELNNFTGTLGSGSFLAVDNGTDTGKLSTQQLLAATEARIDNIIAGPAPSAEEIVDARRGADGVPYPSLGDAIRDQFTDVKSDISFSSGLRGLTHNSATWIDGYVNDSGGTSASPNFKRTSNKIDVSTNKYVSVHCPISYTSIFASLYNNDTHIKNIVVSNGGLFRIPDGANKVIINLYFGTDVGIPAVSDSIIITSEYPSSETAIKSNVDGAIEIINGTKDNYYDLLDYVSLEQGKFNLTTGVKESSSTQYRTANKIKLPIGTTINIVALSSFFPHVLAILKYGYDGSFLGAEENIQTYDTYKIATYTTTSPYINIAFYSASLSATEAQGLFRLIVIKPQPLLNGKKVSVLGDSLSSYDGFSDHDTAYYPKNNLGLDSVSQMYWAMVANVLGLTIDTINAYGGSRVASPGNNYISSDARLSDLGSPDIILFAAGTNDIYADTQTGIWSGDNLSTLDTSKFIPAYTKCIKYIQTYHPNATIIAISPCFITANSDARQYCTVENLQRIAEAEKLVCDYMGVKFIDCRKLGMNQSNIADYTVEQLHWNYKFHKLVADKVISELID